jgi:hypothetical protein
VCVAAAAVKESGVVVMLGGEMASENQAGSCALS